MDFIFQTYKRQETNFGNKYICFIVSKDLKHLYAGGNNYIQTNIFQLSSIKKDLENNKGGFVSDSVSFSCIDYDDMYTLSSGNLIANNDAKCIHFILQNIENCFCSIFMSNENFIINNGINYNELIEDNLLYLGKLDAKITSTDLKWLYNEYSSDRRPSKEYKFNSKSLDASLLEDCLFNGSIQDIRGYDIKNVYERFVESEDSAGNAYSMFTNYCKYRLFHLQKGNDRVLYPSFTYGMINLYECLRIYLETCEDLINEKYNLTDDDCISIVLDNTTYNDTKLKGITCNYNVKHKAGTKNYLRCVDAIEATNKQYELYITDDATIDILNAGHTISSRNSAAALYIHRGMISGELMNEIWLGYTSTDGTYRKTLKEIKLLLETNSETLTDDDKKAIEDYQKKLNYSNYSDSLSFEKLYKNMLELLNAVTQSLGLKLIIKFTDPNTITVYLKNRSQLSSKAISFKSSTSSNTNYSYNLGSVDYKHYTQTTVNTFGGFNNLRIQPDAGYIPQDKLYTNETEYLFFTNKVFADSKVMYEKSDRLQTDELIRQIDKDKRKIEGIYNCFSVTHLPILTYDAEYFSFRETVLNDKSVFINVTDSISNSLTEYAEDYYYNFHWGFYQSIDFEGYILEGLTCEYLLTNLFIRAKASYFTDTYTDNYGELIDVESTDKAGLYFTRPLVGINANINNNTKCYTTLHDYLNDIYQLDSQTYTTEIDLEIPYWSAFRQVLSNTNIDVLQISMCDLVTLKNYTIDANNVLVSSDATYCITSIEIDLTRPNVKLKLQNNSKLGMYDVSLEYDPVIIENNNNFDVSNKNIQIYEAGGPITKGYAVRSYVDNRDQSVVEIAESIFDDYKVNNIIGIALNDALTGELVNIATGGVVNVDFGNSPCEIGKELFVRYGAGGVLPADQTDNIGYANSKLNISYQDIITAKDNNNLIQDENLYAKIGFVKNKNSIEINILEYKYEGE